MLRPSPTPDRLRGSRGFTLIELMTVVAILGVLAVVAVAGYTKQARNARKAEVLSNVSGIALRQKNHLAVAGHYASSTDCEGTTCTYPDGATVTGADGVIAWGVNDAAYTRAGQGDAAYFRGGGDLHGFDALRFVPEGGTSRCGYATVSGYGTNAMDAGEADEPITATLADLVFPAGPAGEPYYARDWFYTYALCDFDHDGVFWAFTGSHYTSDVNYGSDPSGTYLEGE